VRRPADAVSPLGVAHRRTRPSRLRQVNGPLRLHSYIVMRHACHAQAPLPAFIDLELAPRLQSYPASDRLWALLAATPSEAHPVDHPSSSTDHAEHSHSRQLHSGSTAGRACGATERPWLAGQAQRRHAAVLLAALECIFRSGPHGTPHTPCARQHVPLARLAGVALTPLRACSAAVFLAQGRVPAGRERGAGGAGGRRWRSGAARRHRRAAAQPYGAPAAAVGGRAAGAPALETRGAVAAASRGRRR
jgi:hypothetical protein